MPPSAGSLSAADAALLGLLHGPAELLPISSSGHVIVKVLAEGPIDEPTLIRFDNNGKACDSSDIYNGNMWGGSDPRIPGTHECGPWELDDTEI